MSEIQENPELFEYIIENQLTVVEGAQSRWQLCKWSAA